MLPTILIIIMFLNIHTEGQHLISNNQCNRTMTLKQILELLNQHPCHSILLQVNQHVHKRNTDAGNLNVHALQTTINDHRTMINYLINNSINATFVADAISSHHSKTGPILSSWRDIIDICTVFLLLGFIIYYGIFRTGFGPCDKLISCFCRPVIERAQNQLPSAPAPAPISRINHGYAPQ